MAKVAVIIPAAGAGRRFRGGENKIFQPLAGRAVFLCTLDAFARRPDVCQIRLVLSRGDMASAQRRHGRELRSMNVELVEGGRTRAHSVRNALGEVCGEAELICVHDAVRPCLARAWIDAVFHAAERWGAAILACPVQGTLKRIAADHLIERTVPRAGLWQAQTPQVFRKDLLSSAYQGDLGGVTDDAQLVEAAGHTVRVVPSAPRNLKITTPADLALAEAANASLRQIQPCPQPTSRPDAPDEDTGVAPGA